MVRDFRDASEVAPMDEEMTRLFMVASTGELVNKKTVALDNTFALDLGFAGQVLERRLAVMSPETRISFGVAVVLTYHCKGNPGRAVLWAYTMHRMALDYGTDAMITMAELTNAFPMGFPTDRAFMELWDGQKSHTEESDNLLDVKETWLAV